MKNLILGIDPGFSGALALIDRNSDRLITLDDMPTIQQEYKQRGKTKSKQKLDTPKLVWYFRKYGVHIEFAVVEKVHAFTYVNKYGETRGQGAASSFKFGFGAGVIEGVLSAFSIRIVYLEPSVWKALMGLSRDKNKSRELAVKKFPEYAELFKLKKHDGRAEAALIAWFGKDRL